MTADRAVSLIGLAFGDCGKGLATDHLVRRLDAHTVVRFNGGAQAGHNVVLPDGRRHTFSQFGAGSFNAGVVTVLAERVVVHPTALVEEARALAACGIDDACARLCIDARCRVTTPFHQAAGRLREWARGADAHGSCGAGFGETVGHAIAHRDQVIHWSDLVQPAAAAAAPVEDRLEAIRRTLRDELVRIDGARPCASDGHIAAEWRILEDPGVARRWMARARDAARRVGGGTDAALHMTRSGTIVFEGAQGMLLDEHHGFHPHTTWSEVGPRAVEAVLDEVGRPPDVVHLGVLRSYLTRHGAGPMPTEDAALDAVLAEPDNHDAGWQGRFRRGHIDAVLLRHAIDAAGSLDGLFVTHLDAFERTGSLRWCEAYRDPTASTPDASRVLDPHDPGRILALNAAPVVARLEVSKRLGDLLRRVVPQYAAQPPRTGAAFIERVEAETRLPVHFGSRGPTRADVEALTMRFGTLRTNP